MLVLLYKPKLELFRAFWGEFGVLCLNDLVFLAIYLFLVVIVKLGLRQGLKSLERYDFWWKTRVYYSRSVVLIVVGLDCSKINYDREFDSTFHALNTKHAWDCKFPIDKFQEVTIIQLSRNIILYCVKLQGISEAK